MRALILAMGCACLACATLPPAPEARLSARFTRLDGTVLTLGGLRGRVVLVTAMSTWAEPAILEVPRLKALAEAERALSIVCVVLEPKAEMARIFKQTFEIPYEVVTVEDPARFTGADGPLGKIALIPTSWLLDRQGRLAARMDGMWAPQVLEDAVRRLVAEDPGAR